jgi:hypothetical protein
MKMIIEYATTAGLHVRISECLMGQGQQLRLESLEQYDYGTFKKAGNPGVRLWITLTASDFIASDILAQWTGRE